MRKRWRVVAVLVVALVVFALWPRPERITRENFNRIRGGMTQPQVEAILGPAGDYRTGDVCLAFGVDTKNVWNNFDPHWTHDAAQEWQTDTDHVSVFYDRGAVVATRYHTQTPFERDIRSRLRWLRLHRWQRWLP